MSEICIIDSCDFSGNISELIGHINQCHLEEGEKTTHINYYTCKETDCNHKEYSVKKYKHHKKVVHAADTGLVYVEILLLPDTDPAPPIQKSSSSKMGKGKAPSKRKQKASKSSGQKFGKRAMAI